VLRDDSRIAGIVPCFLHDWNGRRQLTMIGAGISDYLDPALDPGRSNEIVDALQTHLAASRHWEVCDWQDLSADSPLGALGTATDDTPCFELTFTQPWEAFIESRPKHLKRNLRQCREKAAAAGELEFFVSGEADRELLTSLIDLHGARWRRSGQRGTIESNHSAAFIRDVAAVLASRNMLRIFSLRLNGRIVAIVLALRNNSTLFSYLTAYDPTYKQYGFGHELLARALRWAHDHGYRSWNFLRGDESYKLDWGADRIPKCRLVLARAGAT
jgi:CelD/BcsL family acetyltransferase involved in cellulose biosynthesis